MMKRLQVASDQTAAFINETKGANVTPALEHILTQLVTLEKDLIQFDRVAFQPSKVVYIASIIVKHAKTMMAIFGMAVMGYLVSSFIVPSLFL